MAQFDVVVVGAGISGLSLAQYCATAGLRTAVLERNTVAGGALQTFRTDQGFWVELGAHTCYNSYGHLIGLLEAQGMLQHLEAREKVRWMLRTARGLESIASNLNFMELLASLPRLFTANKRGLTVEAYYSRILGRRNFRKVVGPMLNAVVSQDARGFPADQLFRKRPRRKDIRRSFTLPGGLQDLPQALVKSNTFFVGMGNAVQTVETTPDGFRVVTATGEEHASAALALATPASFAAALLQHTHPALSALLERIQTREIDTVGAVVRADQVRLPRVAGIVVLDGPYYSVVSRDTVPHDTYRGFAFHFKPGLDEAARLKEVSGLLEVPREALSWTTTRHILPAPVLGHDRLVAEIDRALSGQPLLLTGNYFAGLAIEDCLSRSATEAQRLKALWA